MKQLQFALFTSFLLLFSLNGLIAQQNHFIYIQTENKQPFYVKLDKKLLSSSISGYILLPKLKDGQHNLVIGFPKNEWPEQSMVCTINNNDIGYLLKDFGSRGWGLFNLQTLEVVMAADKAKTDNILVVNKTDAFSNMLSSVVNDSTIRQTESVREEVNKDTVKAEEKLAQTVVPTMDSAKSLVVVETGKAEQKPEVKEVVITPKEEKVAEKVIIEKQPEADKNAARSAITRSTVNKSPEGTEMVFIDETDGKKDTIIVFIQAETKPVVLKETAAEVPASKKKSKKKSEKVKETKFLDIELSDKNETVAKPVENVTPKKELEIKKTDADSGKKQADNPVVVTTPESNPVENPVVEKVPENKPVENVITEKVSEVKPSKTTEEKKPFEIVVISPAETKDTVIKKTQPVRQTLIMINSDCKNFATEEDFLKLRKKMVGEENDDDMVAIARKSFKAKCYTVEQVKNLSFIFLKDAGKYAFFDMAYPFVADSENFKTLQSQLTEPYYIDRFKAMIRH